jgi:thiamine pyrophosphokinase
MGICYIVGSMADGYRVYKKDGDLVIAVDAGYKNLKGVKPDLVMGDFDSLGFIPNGENIITFPVAKDDTDTLLAVKEGLKRGYKTFVISGGLGGRLDHTMANIQTLAFLAERGARGYLVSENEFVTVIKDTSIEFDKEHSGNISVFALSDKAEGVTLEGLKYPLYNATLTPTFPIGVSNSFTEKTSKVTVKNGMILIIAGNINGDWFFR